MGGRTLDQFNSRQQAKAKAPKDAQDTTVKIPGKDQGQSGAKETRS
ncbi:MAG: hypothetical protein P4N59_06625 [Negativicutes bacterium]|nr:hypothetical protein [Negativicutes bacterium]